MEMPRKQSTLKRDMKHFWPLYVLFAPIAAYFIVFRYIPIFLQFPLVLINYKIRDGLFGSKWVGFEHFIKLFTSFDFPAVLYNTVRLFTLSLAVGFLPPIILAILLQDMQSRKLSRACQTVLYVPHFFSWVIIYGLAWSLFASASGIVNTVLKSFGRPPVDFLTNPNAFLPMILGTGLWKTLGWSTIIYMAALSSIDPQLYEAAIIDGAGPVQRIRHVTFPHLKPIMTFTLVMSLGGVLGAGGEQVLLCLQPSTLGIGDVLSTWVYRRGVVNMSFSYAAAAGFFQGIVGLVLVLIANKASQKLAGRGIW